MDYLVEISHDGGKTWERYGKANTRRTAQIVEATSRYEFPGAEARIRKVRR